MKLVKKSNQGINKCKDKIEHSTTKTKYFGKNCHIAVDIASRNSKPFQEGEFLKKAWLTFASTTI